MEKAVQVQFENGILERFIKMFELEERAEKLGDFENYVFKVFKKDTPLALRITHSSHRNFKEISAELDWVNHLHANDVACPKTFTSMNGNIIETLSAEDGTQFFACLFSFVPGTPVKMNSDIFNDHLFYLWGKETGKMHAATKKYQPSDGIKPRPNWDEEELLEIEKFVEDETVIENTKLLIEEIKQLPQNIDNFGLIHTDIHNGNFFYDRGTIQVFDFDDCSYHWFASDIAIPLYYSIYYGYNDASTEVKKGFANRFLENFLKGYKTENPIPANIMEHIPLFFKLRDITLYSVLHKKIAPEDRNERLNQLLESMRKRIVHKELIVNL